MASQREQRYDSMQEIVETTTTPNNVEKATSIEGNISAAKKSSSKCFQNSLVVDDSEQECVDGKNDDEVEDDDDDEDDIDFNSEDSMYEKEFRKRREYSLTGAPQRPIHKRPRVDMAELDKVRKRLFVEDADPPTISKFSVDGERIDMEDRDTCEMQREYFARIYNTLLCFSRCDLKKLAEANRNLPLAARSTARQLEKMSSNGNDQYYLDVPKAVMYVLRTLEDVYHLQSAKVIVQLIPITCVIEKCVQDKLDVESLELRSVNGKVSMSVNLNTDIKFLFGGLFSTKVIPEQGEKNYIAPTICVGNYLNTVVQHLYNLIHQRTKKYIRRLFRENPEHTCGGGNVTATSSGVVTIDPLGESMSRNAYDNRRGDKKVKNTGKRDTQETLDYLLRTVGRTVRLKKIDLNKTNVFVPTSDIKVTPKYMHLKNDNTFTMETKPIRNKEAVFLSSYVRARIMEDGSLNFQIYSRSCICLNDKTDGL